MTTSGAIDPSLLLHAVPQKLREELLSAYNSILKNYRERRWEPAELNGGKLCEVVYTILRGFVDGAFPSRSTKPSNMVDACNALAKASSTSFSRSVRIQIPRMLVSLYEIRNNRGVGHVGGDVDPNHMDAVCVLQMSKWILGELVRIFHAVSTETAAVAVEAIVERTLPIVWEVGGKLRVLQQMSMKDRTLVLLYHRAGHVAENDLVTWIEHSNAWVFRRDVLRPAHKKKLLEYDGSTGTIHISPLGIDYVESTILK